MTALKHYIVSAILAIVMMQGDTLWATPNHPFWTGAEYTIADSLHAGDRLYGADGGNIFIEEIIRKDTSAEVYNFAVEGNENYYVGRSSILVHNSNCFLKNIENLDILSANLNNLSPLLKKQFLQDFENAGSELLEVLNKPNGVKAWDILHDAGYATLRKNPVSLQKLNNLISNPNLTTSNLTEDLVRRAIKGNRGAGAGAAALDDLTDGLNSLVNSGTNFTNYTRLVGDLEKGSGFAEGAGWVQKYLVGNTSEFAGKNLEFEIGVISGRVDLKVGNILYEFKSVGSLPPTSFTNQVARDLQNVTSFDQMKWYFDGDKLPNRITQADKDAMLSALDNMNLDEATIRKFVTQPPFTVEAVVNQIEIRFSQIFQVK